MDPSFTLPPGLVGTISPLTAHALSFLFTSSYVGSLYLSQALFKSRSPSSSRAATPRTDSPHRQREPGHEPNAPSTKTPPVILPLASEVDNTSGIFPPATHTGTHTDRYKHEYDDLRPVGPPVGSRDHPLTMKRRMKAVSISTLLSLSGVFLSIRNIFPPSSSASLKESGTLAMHLLGLRLPSRSGWTPYLLAPLLMAGPLFSMWLEEDLPLIGRRRYGESIWSKIKRSLREAGLIELRNYVIGPLTEELVFRSTILSVSILSGLSFRSLVFGTPLWFGVAHAHHALESYRKNGSTSSAAIQAILGCLFQLTYTTLFGWFASYLYLRTGSVVPPLLSHMFCNIMGIHLPSTAIARHPRLKPVIWGSYFAGIVGFTIALKNF